MNFVHWKPALLALLALAIAANADAQQYQYQPAPDYYRNNAAEGTVVGGGLGAMTGAIIGGRSNRGEGALIGAGIGALTGHFFGKQQDAVDQQQAAAGYAYTAQANAQAQQLAVTNYDLIEMTRAGLSDQVIVGAIQQRGGRFDLSPQGLIALKQNGVSDTVVASAQSLVTASGTAPTTVITPAPAPAPVYYRPAPAIRVHYGFGGFGGYAPRHRAPRRRAGFHFHF